MAQIIILGGGISACWTFNTLRSLGYDAILISKGGLGGEQTLASQGMIHGGQRYSLQGALNPHTTGIAKMPDYWEGCFKGENIPDLRQVKLLAHKQYLWSAGGIVSGVTAFFASKAMNTKVISLQKKSYPQVFDNQKFKGQLYELPEVVVDSLSLIKGLIAPYAESVMTAGEIKITTDGNSIKSIVVDGTRKLDNPAFVLSASGKGNEDLASEIFPGEKTTQRRPLKQVLVKELPYALYAHCITTDPRPRVTISAHPIKENNSGYVWNLGGLVGVYGVDKSDEEALEFAFKEMSALFPWINWRDKQWAVLPVDRAEPYASTGWLPDGPAIKSFSNGALVWPTKLTFAPVVAELALKQLAAAGIKAGSIPAKESGSNLGNHTSTDLKFSDYPWDTAKWKKI